MSSKRIVWIDNIKVLAVALVVLGHFFQSMVSAGLLGPTAAYRYFIQFIYWFHVPLLFLCSGFLYQRYTKTDSVAAWARNAGKKFAAFSVPYFFSAPCPTC